ncbi:hypothetical protein [Aquitalea sp. USM4]|nr:hypothetical protein [Aquitalea sp. USM4]
MKDLFAIVIGILPCLSCLAASIYLAVKEKKGWGWFLFLALLFVPSIHIA